MHALKDVPQFVICAQNIRQNGLLIQPQLMCGSAPATETVCLLMPLFSAAAVARPPQPSNSRCQVVCHLLLLLLLLPASVKLLLLLNIRQHEYQRVIKSHAAQMLP